jgi:Leucine-rich repeat (LRR) protein
MAVVVSSMLFFNNDINSVIVQFISNKRELLNFRNICRSTYYPKHCVKFVCKHLSNQYHAEYLDLSDSTNSYTDQDMYDMGQHITYLVCSNYVQDFHLKIIPKLRTLKCLYNTVIKDVSSLSYLQKLSCGYTDISDFSNLGNLLVLNCDNNYSINDACFQYLSKLQILTCGISNLSDACLQYLPNLVILTCGINTSFTDSGIQYLKQLQALECHSCNITDKSINQLQYLEYLKVSRTSDIYKISLPNLMQLNCNDNESIVDSCLDVPNLRILNCNSNITNESIKTMTKLTYLDLGLNMNISNISCLKDLTTLICGINNIIGDNSLSHLTNLEYLDCHHAGLNFSDVSLQYLTKLNYLYYSEHCLFTSKEVKKIKSLHHWFIRSTYGYDYIVLS